MERYSIFDATAAAPAPETLPSKPDMPSSPQTVSRKVLFPGEDGGRSLNAMAQRDLFATLQLLAERAQYITGATGSAIALREGEKIVCRASAGSVAPEAGAELQMESGLSGESIRTKQVMRCDDSHSDPRVNRESCEALGIASVIIIPLVREKEVNGVFELFSDRTFAFEERDITALERLGEMVQTALDHAAAAHTATPAEVIVEETPSDVPADQPERKVTDKHAAKIYEALAKVDAVESKQPEAANDLPTPIEGQPSPAVGASLKLAADVSAASPAPIDLLKASDPGTPAAAEAGQIPPTASTPSIQSEPRVEKSTAADSVIPAEDAKPALETPTSAVVVGEEPAASALAGDKTPILGGIQKCSSCGFPVSAGRELCLDCEKKQKPTSPELATRATGRAATELKEAVELAFPTLGMSASSEEEGSWFSRHRVLVVVAVVAVASVLAVVLLR